MSCVINGFYSYPISHVVLPMIVTRYYDSGFNSVLFALSAVALWEFIEVVLIETAGSYVIFGDSINEDVNNQETLCNVSFLDIGNGILGASLAYATIGGKLKQSINYWVHWIIFILVGILYSFLSGFSWYCAWDPDCNGEMVDFPWGNVVNIILLSAWFYFCFENVFWLWVNVILISVAGTIPLISSAVMVYIGTTICFAVQLLRKRPEYELLP